MNIGEQLKVLREHSGYSQSELAKKLDVPQTSISNFESRQDLNGILDYIFKLCTFIDMPVFEFFMKYDKISKKDLPPYITKDDAEIFKILNTAVDIKTRIEVKKLFVQTMKIVLLQSADKIKHMPEFKALFPEDTDLNLKIADTKAEYKGE